MIQNPANINIFWASLIVDELFRHGVTFFCISPGSRSTPLTVAAAAHDRTETQIALDERGAAFYALGYARAANRPAVLICTSGSATANYFPAVVEAYQSRIPLIILSADRPPELRDSGANQTIDQVGIYGSYVNWAIDLPAPDTAIKPEFVLSSVDQAVYRSIRPPAGPVHINCMFREPLEPQSIPVNEDYAHSITMWSQHQEPWTRYIQSASVLSETDLRAVATELDSSAKTVLTVGRTGNDATLTAIADLARAAGWPVFADIASGWHPGDDRIFTIHWYDQLLATESFKELLEGCRILHFGDPLTSKRFLQFVTANPPGHYIHVHDHCRRQDPAHCFTRRIETDVAAFCNGLKRLMKRSEPNPEFNIFNDRAGKIVEGFIEQLTGISEISIAKIIAATLPAGQGLFLGNSMPVRDFDMFGRLKNYPIRVGANRGASGIDGSVASAAGFARGISAPVTAVIGDLAFLHDLNSLDLIRKSKHQIILVVINNNGGGIFSFLPIASYKEVFEPYFATPHNLHFGSAAELFGINHTKVTDSANFLSVYRKGLKQENHDIIEVITDREENYVLHRKLLDRIIAEIDGGKE